LPVVVFAGAERGNVVRMVREEQTHAGQPVLPGLGRAGRQSSQARQARDRRERQ